jgi:hypothetical protein
MSNPERRGPDIWTNDPAAWWAAWLRAWGLRAPLSGDVSQDIDASLIRSVGDQLGFININTSQSSDPQLERHIVTEVAGYGRQLGRILDALDVLVRQSRHEKLSAAERRALDDMQALHAEIAAAKTRYAGGRVDRLIEEIRAVRQNPDSDGDALQRLRDALDGD